MRNFFQKQVTQALEDKNLSPEDRNILTILKMSTCLVEDLDLGIQWEIQVLAKGVDKKFYLVLHPLSCSNNWKSYEQVLVCPLTEYFTKFKILDSSVQVFYE